MNDAPKARRWRRCVRHARSDARSGPLSPTESWAQHRRNSNYDRTVRSPLAVDVARRSTIGYGLYLLLAVPAAGFLVRLFMIQHDCGHGSFFRHRLANDWVGRVIGVLTLTPYDFWRRTHAIHHATSGNLDRRGIGDVDTLTVREYLTLSRWRRLRYRLYRHPLVMFGVGPTYLFILRHRLPIGLMRAGWHPGSAPWRPTLAIALIVAAMMWWVGVWPFLLVHLPITLIGGAMGVWLFYVQHQFEHTVWSAQRDLELPRRGALRQFALRSAGRAALVHRQYRRAPCPPPLQPDSVLPVAARSFASTPISRISAGSLWLRVFRACAWCSGMKRHAGSFRFANCERGFAHAPACAGARPRSLIGTSRSD